MADGLRVPLLPPTTVSRPKTAVPPPRMHTVILRDATGARTAKRYPVNPLSTVLHSGWSKLDSPVGAARSRFKIIPMPRDGCVEITHPTRYYARRRAGKAAILEATIAAAAFPTRLTPLVHVSDNMDRDGFRRGMAGCYRRACIAEALGPIEEAYLFFRAVYFSVYATHGATHEATEAARARLERRVYANLSGRDIALVLFRAQVLWWSSWARMQHQPLAPRVERGGSGELLLLGDPEPHGRLMNATLALWERGQYDMGGM